MNLMEGVGKGFLIDDDAVRSRKFNDLVDPISLALTPGGALDKSYYDA